MPSPDDLRRQEALGRLNEQAKAFAAKNQRPVSSHAAGEQAVSQAYRIIAELIGGVLMGLAAGFIFDRVFKTTPWGLVGGVLLGFALSIWMARRTANRLMALANSDAAPIPSVPFDDDDEER
jgi:ATP synthase protein I